MLELLASDNRVLIQIVMAWTVCLAALIWGGGPERAVALTWLVVFEIGLRIMTPVLGLRIQLMSIDLWLITCEFAASALLVWVALYANRNYTLGIAALQVLAMTAHLARGLADTISTVAYAVMIAVPGWFQLALIAVGLTRHILRKRKHGPYRDWRFDNTNPILLGAAAQLGPNPEWDQSSSPSWRDDLK